MIDKLKQHWVGISFFLAVGFLIFRLFIADDKNPSVLTSPYANEIAAAFLGTLLTVIVTALLLEKTTESQRKLQEDLQTRTDQSQAKLLDQTDKRQAELAVQQAKLQGQLQVDLLNQTNKSQAELAIQQAKLQADLLEKTNESQAKLLERQALQEESKEKNLAIYEKKFEAYKSLMDALEEAMCEGQPKEAARNKLRFQAFRTRFIAHKIVVDKLNDFSAVYINLVKDNEFSEEDRDECSDAVNALVDAMRADLEADRTGIPLVATAVEANILKASTDSVSNGQSISTPSLIQQAQLTSGSSDFTPKITKEEFLAQCEEVEKPYFADALAYCESYPDLIVIDWGGKGFSVKDKNRRQILWMFPKAGANSKSNINARTQKLTDGEKSQVRAILDANGIKSGWSWRPADLPFPELKKIINLVCGI